MYFVFYSGAADAANATSAAENEEHSQIIIHCTPSTGSVQPMWLSFLTLSNTGLVDLNVLGGI